MICLIRHDYDDDYDDDYNDYDDDDDDDDDDDEYNLDRLTGETLHPRSRSRRDAEMKKRFETMPGQMGIVY
ncbi:hypothetical protein G9A89_021767 [Geosiphon pyriformis]|nr:hypothetical protein G9A89_021767 [Geosiphon pyriformis]